MNLYLVGIDHTTAPVSLRERLAFAAEELPIALAQLTRGSAEQPALLAEAAILSTCNRVEVYGVANDAETSAQMVAFLAHFHAMDPAELAPHLFHYSGEAVATHLCATAAGLRSIVLGEAQIQGQVRLAAEIAQQAGSSGPILNALFRHALAAGKRVRHQTALGTGPASVSQAGVELAQQQLGTLAGRRVLLVGSGKVSELAMQNLRAYGATDLRIANRTHAHALDLAERYGAEAIPFETLPAALTEADIVISSTAAPTPVIECAHVKAALQTRHNTFASQMLILDLAVPRDVAPDVATLPGVSVYTVDDLQHVVSDTLAQRRAAVAAAEAIVAEEQAEWSAWLRSQETLRSLTSLRQRAEALRTAEMQRAMRRLSALSPEQHEAVEALTQSLVNKLLHTPTVRLKHAAAAGDGSRYASMLSELFDLEGA